MLDYHDMEWVSTQATRVFSWHWQPASRMLAGVGMSNERDESSYSLLKPNIKWFDENPPLMVHRYGIAKTRYTSNKMLCNMRNELHFQNFKDFWLSEIFRSESAHLLFLSFARDADKNVLTPLLKNKVSRIKELDLKSLLWFTRLVVNWYVPKEAIVS